VDRWEDSASTTHFLLPNWILSFSYDVDGARTLYFAKLNNTPADKYLSEDSVSTTHFLLPN
jgi:hypothetical protein